MLILVNRAEEKLSVHREIAKFLTVYRVCYTPIETLLVNMGLHAAIIRLSPLIHEGEQRYKPLIVDMTIW